MARGCPATLRGWVEKPGRCPEPDAQRGESEGLTAALRDDYDEGVGSSPHERGSANMKMGE